MTVAGIWYVVAKPAHSTPSGAHQHAAHLVTAVQGMGGGQGMGDKMSLALDQMSLVELPCGM